MKVFYPKVKPLGPKSFPREAKNYCKKRYKDQVEYVSRHTTDKNVKIFSGIQSDIAKFDKHIEEASKNANLDTIDKDELFNNYLDSKIENSLERLKGILTFINEDKNT